MRIGGRDDGHSRAFDDERPRMKHVGAIGDIDAF